MAVRAIPYTIKVEVIEVRGLSFKESAGEKEIVPNPYVDVTVGGTTKSTVQKNQVVSATFNASFNFQATLTPEEFQRSYIELDVMHRYTLLGGVGLQSALIGKYVLSFACVYSKSQHWIYRQWIKLNNFEQLIADPVRASYHYSYPFPSSVSLSRCLQLSTIVRLLAFRLSLAVCSSSWCWLSACGSVLYLLTGYRFLILRQPQAEKCCY